MKATASSQENVVSILLLHSYKQVHDQDMRHEYKTTPFESPVFAINSSLKCHENKISTSLVICHVKAFI